MARARKDTRRSAGGPRPYWRGHLKLSLVTCPIAVYSATSEKNDVHLHFLNPKTGNRIRYQVIDAETEEPVERSDLVRGYEFAKDRYVTISDDELDELKVESSTSMVVESFVAENEIPPIYFDNAYYVAPDGEAGAEAFAVIRDAMAKARMFAVSRAVFSRRERVIAMRAEGKGIVAYTLREATDIKPAEDFFDDIKAAQADADMLAMARKLVEGKTAKFKPAEFEDRYEARIRALVDAKLKGVDLEDEEEAPAANVVNLMDALKRSLAGGGKAKPENKKSATVHRLPVAKKTATRRASTAKTKPKPKSRKSA